MKMLPFLAASSLAALFSLTVLAEAEGDAPRQEAKLPANPFRPESAPSEKSLKIPLDVTPGSGMMFVKGSIAGEDCMLLWDTGCTHTTFDKAFMKRITGSDGVPVEIGGETNVADMPHLYTVDSFSLKTADGGEAAFGRFAVMSVDMRHMVGSVGTRVDGVIGMNVIGRVPAITCAAKGEIVLNPRKEECAGFGSLLRTVEMDSLLVPVKAGEKVVLMLVDSGSSFSFLKEGLWETAGEAGLLGAVDANGRGTMRSTPGVEGVIDAGGAKIRFKPLVVPENRNYIGSDVLRRCDILTYGGYVAFRPLE